MTTNGRDEDDLNGASYGNPKFANRFITDAQSLVLFVGQLKRILSLIALPCSEVIVSSTWCNTKLSNFGSVLTNARKCPNWSQ
jgi:hypothetical protein